MSTEFEVNLADLRAALVSVLPHVDKSGNLPVLGQIRLIPDAVNVTALATDRFTAGMALVSITDHRDEGADVMDLDHEDVRKVLAVFKAPPKDEADQVMVRIRRTTNTVTFIDGGGLFDGQELTLPLGGNEDSFPDLTRLFGRYLRAKSPMEAEQASVINAEHEHKFLAAAKAYGSPLVIERHLGAVGGMHLVHVGESFLGLVTLMHTDTEDGLGSDIKTWRRAWIDRLPAPRGTVQDLAEWASHRTPDDEPNDVDDEPGEDQ